MDVFISYSRKDREFVRKLHDALAAAGRDVWVDWEDIPPTADWPDEVKAGIDSSESFVFVLSPASAASEACGKELGRAVDEGKRIIPLVREHVDSNMAPPSLARRNWIPFSPTDDFDASVQILLTALDTDLEWVKEHTRFLVRANEWEGSHRDKSLLLRGSELRDAERWLAQQAPDKEPHPTALQSEYVFASRRGAARRQRGIFAAVSLALVAAAALAVIAWIQRGHAVTQARIAQSRELAASSTSELHADPELSLLLAARAMEVTPTAQAELALRTALAESHIRKVLTAGRKAMTSAGFSQAKGSLAVTVSSDGTVRVWSLQTGRVVSQPGGPGANAVAATFIADGSLVSVGKDGTATSWNPDAGASTGSTPGPVPDVGVAAVSPGGTLVLSAEPEGSSATVWDRTTGQVVRVLTGHTEAITAAAFSAAGDRVATGSDDRTALIWSVSGTGPPLKVSPKAGKVRSVAFSPDGRLLVTGSAGVAMVWDAASGGLLDVLRGHTGVVTDAAFSPDSRLVVTSADDDTARVWARGSGVELEELLGHARAVNAASFSPDGRSVITASNDGTARLWDVTPGPQVFHGHAEPVWTARFRPDGAEIVTASKDQTAGVWDAVTGIELHAYQPDLGQVKAAAFDPSGRLVVLGTAEQVAELWNTTTEGQPGSFQGHQAAVVDASFDPRGDRVVTASRDGTAKVWDVSSGGAVLTLTGHTGQVRTARFSPDGKEIVTAGDDGTVRVWDAATGGTRFTIRAESGVVRCAVFSPDGTKIVTAGNDGTVRVWDAGDGKAIESEVTHTGAVNSVAFTPDGMLVASAGADGLVVIQDTRNWRAVATLAGPRGAVNDVAFNATGDALVTAADDGAVRVYPRVMFAPLDEVTALVPHRTTRSLTPAEVATFLHKR